MLRGEFLRLVAAATAMPYPLHVNEGGRDYRLTATFYTPDGPGPFPLVVLNHGAPANYDEVAPRLLPRHERIGKRRHCDDRRHARRAAGRCEPHRDCRRFRRRLRLACGRRARPPRTRWHHQHRRRTRFAARGATLQSRSTRRGRPPFRRNHGGSVALALRQKATFAFRRRSRGACTMRTCEPRIRRSAIRLRFFRHTATTVTCCSKRTTR